MKAARANRRRASDRAPVLNDSDGGKPSWMEWCTAYRMELFNMPEHREWALSVIDGKTQEVTQKYCEEA
eukprot:9217626-Pyramimonas_sp.AAC.1